MCDICLQNSEPEVKQEVCSSTSKTISDFWSQIYFMPFVLKYPLAIQYLLGLRRKWIFFCGTLSHAVKCLSVYTQYKNLDLLS